MIVFLLMVFMIDEYNDGLYCTLLSCLSWWVLLVLFVVMYPLPPHEQRVLDVNKSSSGSDQSILNIVSMPISDISRG